MISSFLPDKRELSLMLVSVIPNGFLLGNLAWAKHIFWPYVIDVEWKGLRKPIQYAASYAEDKAEADFPSKLFIWRAWEVNEKDLCIG